MELSHSLLIIFATIFVGIFCERKVFDANQIKGFEILLLKILMPCYLFIAILKHDLVTLFHAEYIYSYLSAFFIIAILVILYFHKNNSVSLLCIKILASAYTNTAIYTVPILTLLLHNPIAGIIGNFLQVILIQTVFVVILNFIKNKEKPIIDKLILIIINPLIIMPIIGLICNYFKIIPHPILMATIQNLGSGVSSLALFIFGLTLGSVKINIKMLNKNIWIIVFMKNIFHPMVAFCVGKYFFHLSGYWLYSLIITASAPTAFVIYLIEKQFSNEKTIADIIVAVSSMFSLISLVIIILLLS